MLGIVLSSVVGLEVPCHARGLHGKREKIVQSPGCIHIKGAMALLSLSMILLCQLPLLGSEIKESLQWFKFRFLKLEGYQPPCNLIVFAQLNHFE